MTLFTKTQTEQLIANCQAQIVRMDNREPDIDFKPVVKLFSILRQAGLFGPLTLRYPCFAADLPTHPCVGVRRMRLTLFSPGTGESEA
jgi:hypothetical protein